MHVKVYVIGDRISIQYGPYLKQYLAGVMDYARKEGDIEAMLNLDNPQGANGGDSSMVLSFMTSLADHAALDADVLLLNCGLHDIKRNPETGKIQVSIEGYERNLRAIAPIAAKMGVQLVWIRTTPCDDAIHNRPGMSFHRFTADCTAYNAVADRVMRESHVPSIDLHTFTRNLGSAIYCDHVHFLDHVREKQGAFIAGWLSCWAAGRRKRKGTCRTTSAG